MGWSWENFASGAVSGGATGAAAGPWGALIGGVGGGILSALTSGGEKEKTPKWVNPYQSQIDYGINEMMNSKIGRDQATAAAGVIRNQATDAIDSFQSNPAFSGNAAASAEAYNKIQRESQRGVRDAFSQGAEVDQATRTQGLQLASENAKMNQTDFMFRTQLDAQPEQPSALEQILTTAGSYGLGKLIGGAGDKPVEPTGAAPPQPPEQAMQTAIDSGSLRAPNRDRDFRTLSSTSMPGGPSFTMPGEVDLNGGFQYPQNNLLTPQSAPNTGGLYRRNRTLTEILMGR